MGRRFFLGRLADINRTFLSYQISGLLVLLMDTLKPVGGGNRPYGRSLAANKMHMYL